MAGGQARNVTLNVLGDNASARKALTDTADVADKSANDTEKSFTSLFSSLQSKGASALGPFEKSFDGLKGTAEKSLDGVKDVFSSKLTQIAGGVSLGVLASEGFNQNIDIKSGAIKLAAQMNLTAEDAKVAGKTSGDVYRDNFGGSIEEVNEAIKSVSQSIGGLSNTSQSDLKHMTESALGLADTFNVDVNDATRGAGKLMSTGLVQSSSEAFDVITRGFQNGLDASGDFLDTLNEYSNQFSKLGLDGTTAIGLLQQGLQAGARDTDSVADAFKEFSIRAIDGSTLTAEGFKAIGMNADVAAAAIGKGGGSAETALNKTIEALQRIKDPVKQNIAGTALFGTQWEDTVRQILPQLNLTRAASTEIAGATDEMNNRLAETPDAKIESMKRHFQEVTASVVELPGPLGTVGQAVTALGPTGITAAAGLLSIATTAAPAISGTFTTAMDLGSKALNLFKGTQVATTVTTEALTVATGQAAVAEGLALGPILAVIAAVALLGFGIYELATHWSQSMEWVQRTSSDAWHWIDSNLVHPVENWFRGIPKFVQDHWGLLLGIIIGPIGPAAKYIYDNFGSIESFFRNFPSRMAGIGSGMWNWLSAPFKGVINTIVGAWNRLHFRIPSFDTHIPGIGVVGGMDVGVSQLATVLDTGGIVTGPTLAALSMNSVPEAVIPLPNLRVMMQDEREKAVQQVSSGNQNINVHVATNADPFEIGREVAWAAKPNAMAS